MIFNIELNLNESFDKWHELLSNNSKSNDFIFLVKQEDYNNLIWFVTNYTQYLTRNGGKEVICLYGNHIGNLDDFIYQVNLSMPTGYKLKKSLDALFDLLLNFETEPIQRFIFWNDTSFLFRVNRNDFDDIFERMIVSAYVNRKAISTIKEDGTRYKVDQRNVFIFVDTEVAELVDLLEKDYYIPSIDKENFWQKLDFNIVSFVDFEK